MSIAVAYTPDRAGKAALDLAIAEAELRGQQLVVINAIKGAMSEDHRVADDSDVESLEETLAKSGIEHVINQPTGTNIAETVLAEVQAASAELLVIGVRRRSPVGKLILGSVAQRLLLTSPVPVLCGYVD